MDRKSGIVIVISVLMLVLTAVLAVCLVPFPALLFVFFLAAACGFIVPLPRPVPVSPCFEPLTASSRAPPASVG